MTEAEREVLTLKGMLANNQQRSAQVVRSVVTKMPKQYTNMFVLKEHKKHSKVFTPSATAEKPLIASSVYLMNEVIPAGATTCTITVTWPDQQV